MTAGSSEFKSTNDSFLQLKLVLQRGTQREEAFVGQCFLWRINLHTANCGLASPGGTHSHTGTDTQTHRHTDTQTHTQRTSFVGPLTPSPPSLARFFPPVACGLPTISRNGTATVLFLFEADGGCEIVP